VSRSLREPEALSHLPLSHLPLSHLPLSHLPLSSLLLPTFAALLAICAVALSLSLSPTVVAAAGQILSASSGGPGWP
jgi:hypothetical protein